jgi:hypothetical protein
MDSRKTGSRGFAFLLPHDQTGKLLAQHAEAHIQVNTEKPPRFHGNEQCGKAGDCAVLRDLFEYPDRIGEYPDLRVPGARLFAVPVKVKVNEPGSDDAVRRSDLTFSVDRRITIPPLDPAIVPDMELGGLVPD